MKFNVKVINPDLQYEEYLSKHKAIIQEAFDNILKPYLLQKATPQSVIDIIQELVTAHDNSKYTSDEWDAYCDKWYIGKEDCDMQAYEQARNHHQKNNPHHWQYWVLIPDEDNTEPTPQDMPFEYVMEMLCDWYSAGKLGDGNSPYDWYKEHYNDFIMSEGTREIIEKHIHIFKNKEDLKERTYTIGDTQYWKRSGKYYSWTANGGRKEISNDEYYRAITDISSDEPAKPRNKIVSSELANHLDKENDRMNVFLKANNYNRGYASITMDNGQMFEKLDKKELISHLKGFEYDGEYEYDEDTSIYLRYSDGSTVMSSNGELEYSKDGVTKSIKSIPKRGIVSYIEDNPGTTVVYGDVKIENWNDTLAGEKMTRYGTDKDEDDWRAEDNI